MNKKFESVLAGFSGKAIGSFIRSQMRIGSVFLVLPLMVFLVPVAWGEQQIFSVTADGQYNLLSSENVETTESNQAQGNLINVPVTNPGAETGDLTGWSTNDFISVVSSASDAHSGSYYFGLNDTQASYSLDPLVTKWHSFGRLTSEVIDLSGTGRIANIQLKSFLRSGDINVVLEDTETEESFIYTSDIVLWIFLRDQEGNFFDGRGRSVSSSEWESLEITSSGLWDEEEWSEMEPRIGQMEIALEARFWAADVADYHPDPNRYHISSYSWTGADGNEYNGNLSDYTAEQLPIVGFDDIELSVDDSSVACNTIYTLPPNEWHQIALPCDPGENNTVAAVFGDDGLGSYGTGWRVFRYDTSSNTYDALVAADILKLGEGYWINHLNEVPRALAMPAGSVATPITYPTGCNNDAGCFKIPLATQSSANQWNMIGYPFEASSLLNNSVVTGVENCASAGCSLDEAMTEGVVHNELWTYSYDDGVAGYTKIVTTIDSGNTTLNPWKGYWAATLQNAAASAPINLLIRK